MCTHCIGLIWLVLHVILVVCINRGSVDGHSDRNCHGNAQNWHGRSCCMCAEVLDSLIILFTVCYRCLSSFNDVWFFFATLLCITTVIQKIDFLPDLYWQGLFIDKSLLLTFVLERPLNKAINIRTPEEVLAAKGVKPTLSPNLDTLALVEVCPYLLPL